MMSNLLVQFENYCINNKLKQKKILLAVSGGLDSMVLCDLFLKFGINFEIAHVNFNLRNEESQRDEKFVVDFANKHKIRFHLKSVDTKKYQQEKGLSIQEAAREIRYNFFEVLKEQFCFDVVCTAHHADDNIETVLMNFCKGTGLKGLHGIKDKAYIKRPLLSFLREELKNYAQLNNVEYVEDSSNDEQKYLRNFFRHSVIPTLQQKIPQIKQNILDNIRRFSDIEDVYNQQTQKLYSKILMPERQGKQYLNILLLKKQKGFKTILLDVLAPFGFGEKQLPDIEHLCFISETGKYLQSDTHQLLKNRNQIIVTKLNEQKQSEIIIPIESQTSSIEYDKKTLSFEYGTIAPIKFENNQNKCWVDEDKLKFPLTLRKYKTGDYFYPIGLGKKKKISKFLIDLKLSKNEKEDVWVLCSQEKIVWVVNHRADERFKIKPSTKKILTITCHS